MISMDWLSSSQRGIRACRERERNTVKEHDTGQISVSSQPRGGSRTEVGGELTCL